MVAEALAQRGGDESDSGPQVSEWSLQNELLATIVDAVTVNTGATVAAAGGKAPKFKPVARPSTEYERAEHRRRLAGHERITAMVKSARARPTPDATSDVSTIDKR